MSRRNSAYPVIGADEYMTPEWAVRALLSVEPVQGSAWEPACGEGAIVRVCREAGADVLATDINPKYSDRGLALDFLGDTLVSRDGIVITNPPYGQGGRLAEKFVRQALKLMAPRRGKAIMLLPVDWDSAKTRQDYFEHFPGHFCKVVLTSRIRWTNLPQKKSGPSQNHAWFVWDYSRRGRDTRWVGRGDAT